MNGYDVDAFRGVQVSVAMTAELERSVQAHLLAGIPRQEDLVFAYWRPSRGARRYNAILQRAVMPMDGDRELHGNVSFSGDYLLRVLSGLPEGMGIALLHSHPGRGWQGMSSDDEFAERERLGGAVAARSQLPVLGLTVGADGAWSARIWVRRGPRDYTRIDASTVRVCGERLRMHYHPQLRPRPHEPESQRATISVWGAEAQADLVRTTVGVIGLGSVGSLVAEALSRMGIQHVILVDHDRIEERNLDRTLHAEPNDVDLASAKVEIAARAMTASHTAADVEVFALDQSLLSPDGIAAALDCDVLFSCVDRPMPRGVLNTIAYSHLIPVVDGGILARVNSLGLPLHIDWRIHSVSPGRRCLYCLGALLRSDVSLDREGKLDDPDYLRGLTEAQREKYGRRNVFPFSMSVAGHEVLQFVGLVTAMPRVGGIGPQHYAAYPGRMDVVASEPCDDDCEVNAATATAIAVSELLI